MRVSTILPAKFDSNMYIYRQSLSDHLNKLVAFRCQFDASKMSLADLQQLDDYLIQSHYDFEKIKMMITIDEFQTFSFGSGNSDHAKTHSI